MTQYRFHECDGCGREIRLSVELTGASVDKSETGRPVKQQLLELQERVETLESGVKGVLEQLDNLAELWGDEGVFRRCRDRLRKLIEKTEGTGGD